MTKCLRSIVAEPALTKSNKQGPKEYVSRYFSISIFLDFVRVFFTLYTNFPVRVSSSVFLLFHMVFSLQVVLARIYMVPTDVRMTEFAKQHI